MTSSGSDVVIIAARRPVAVALEAVLHDWMVQGLADPCRIIDLDSVGNTVPAKLLEGGEARTVLLHDDLAQTRVRRVRVAVVGVVDEEETSIATAQALTVLEAVRQSLPGAPYTQLSITAGSPGSEWASRTPQLYGWHNLAVSPEESVSPSQGSAPLTNSVTDPRWLLHLTGTVCSLTGLWPGQQSALFDERPTPSGGLVVPVRAFSRSVSSGSVQDALASRLIEMGERYPLVRVDRNDAVAIADETNTAIDMAEQLFARHPDVLRRPRRRSPQPQPQQITFWEAIKSFLAMAIPALLNAPSRAWQAMDRSLSAKTASTVQNAIFGGADSGYAVVVRGVRADGSSATWEEYERSLDSVVNRVQSGELRPVAQHPQLWKDFVDGGLTLLDAGARSDGIPYRALGSQRAIITTTSKVAPNPEKMFELPANLAAFLSEWRIEAGDDIAVERLAGQLEHLARNQVHLSQAIGNERNRLREWATAVRESYAGHVGRRLGAEHQAAITEVQAFTQRVEQLSAQPTSVPSDLKERQDLLASNVRVMTGVAATLLAICTALWSLSVFAWPFLLIGALLIMLGWVAGGALAELKASAQIHAELNKLKAVATELEDAQRHRIEALEDLRRISRAYRQYLDWARAFGAFIHAPLGHRGMSGQRELHVGQGLPRNLRIGVAVADPQAIDDVANRWRGSLHRAGWLTDAWANFSNGLPEELGTLRHHIQQDPALLRNDPPINGVPVLTQWSRAVASQAANRPMPQPFFEQIVELIRTDDAARESLLSRVISRNTQGQAQEQPHHAFIEGLGAENHKGALQPGMFNPAGSEIDVRQVDVSLVQNDSAGLDVALVVVELGTAISPSLLAGDTGEHGLGRRLEPSSDGFI